MRKFIYVLENMYTLFMNQESTFVKKGIEKIIFY